MKWCIRIIDFIRLNQTFLIKYTYVSADVLIGVSAKDVFTEEICKSLNKDPIIFAMANPNPECTPTNAHAWRPDCIVATGRSDYPNQINNVMCFPFLFRATLDTRSK